MEKSRAASERIRPILEAMERSIDLARRKRLHNMHPAEPTPTTIPPASHIQQPINEQTDDSQEPYYRRKARPMRPSGVLGRVDDPNYRSQAS